MKRACGPFRVWSLAAIALYTCIFPVRSATAQPAMAPEEQVDAPPPRPVEIHVGLTIVDFARINNRDETFDVHGFLEMRWKDPRLARKPGAAQNGSSKGWRRLHPSREVWIPHLSFVNSLEETKIVSHADVFADDEGNMSQGLDFTGKFSTILDLRRFPFDSQFLRIRVQPTDADSDEIVLVPASFRSGVLEGAYLSDWDVGKSQAHTEDFHYRSDGSNYSTFVLETRIYRRSTYYVYRVLLPLTMLVMASWVVFWFDVTQLQPQISTALSILLSSVLFSFGTDFGMPRAPYLTLIDRQVLLTFLFGFFAIASVAWLHVTLLRKGQAVAERYQRRLRALFPLAYFIALAITHAAR
jgi:Neurotransmitter-gated ion-channel ligand binding domain